VVYKKWNCTPNAANTWPMGSLTPVPRLPSVDVILYSDNFCTVLMCIALPYLCKTHPSVYTVSSAVSGLWQGKTRLTSFWCSLLLKMFQLKMLYSHALGELQTAPRTDRYEYDHSLIIFYILYTLLEFLNYLWEARNRLGIGFSYRPASPNF
jgi:hypothetical protein